MYEEQKQSGALTTGMPRWLGLAAIVLAAVSLGFSSIGWTVARRAKTIGQSLVSQAQALKQNQDTFNQRLLHAEESNAQVRGGLDAVTAEFKLTQGELASVRRMIKQMKEDDARLMAGMQDSVNSMNSMKADIATKSSGQDLERLNSDVTGVKSDLEAIRQNIRTTREELEVLIARNHDGIEQLRRLGERDYYEFTVDRKGARQKVGDLEIELRGTNTKKNLFSVAIYADNMRYEERKRTVNEPIYFYTRGSRTPLALVVNQVGKNKVVGYLSTPKSSAQQATGN